MKNVVSRRAQIQQSCSIADCAHRIECDTRKGGYMQHFYPLNCDIIRRSMVPAYRQFQHFEYFIFVIVYFFWFTAAACTYKRNYLRLYIYIYI